MRTWVVAAVLAIATPAIADEAKPKPAKAEVPKPLCTKKVVGKGLDRHVVCVFEQPIVVPGKPPKPGVVVVAPVDGRKVTGRPRQTDPLVGLHRSRLE